jgi:hypothetical protein
MYACCARMKSWGASISRWSLRPTTPNTFPKAGAYTRDSSLHQMSDRHLDFLEANRAHGFAVCVTPALRIAVASGLAP